MNIYILRHGQTNYNLEGKFQGQIDTILNENGIKQANETKEKLRHINFDIVICSPLKRAIQTAKIVTNKDIITDNRIIERSFGKLEGEYSIPDYEEKLEIYQIETFEELCKRVYKFLEDTIKKYKNQNNILIVTHECIAQVIETYFNDEKNKENWKEYRLETGSYKKYEYRRIRKNRFK